MCCYKIEDCSLYQSHVIGNKLIYVFDDHNMAFPIWGEFSSRNSSSYVLLTFDTHADTRPPFTGAIYSKYDCYDSTTSKKYKSDVLSKYNCDIDNFVFQDAFELALLDIKNDEHIQTACYFGYISDYHVFCALDEYERLSYQRDDQIQGFGAFYYSKDHILSMSDSEIETLIDHPFILDFDLDYFTSKEIFSQGLFQKMKPLIQHASVITIAKEPKYFEYERSSDKFQNEEALGLLLDAIAKAIAE